MDNLFQQIREIYGILSLYIFKEMVKINIKLVKEMNRKIFLLKCRKSRILPNFIDKINIKNLKHHKDNEKYHKLLYNFKVGVLNLEIQNNHSILNTLNEKLNSVTIKFQKIPNSFVKSCFINYLNNLKSKTFQKTKNTHQQKFSTLLKHNTTNIKHNKNWIKNLTDVTLPHNISLCLSLGPNFNFYNKTLNNNLVNETIKNTELLTFEKDKTEMDNIRKDISKNIQIINNTQKINRNSKDTFLNKINTETKTFLRNNTNIIVTKADKGNVTVIQNKTDYLDKSYQLINDTNTYLKLKNDPTNTFQKFNNDLIQHWFKIKLIDQDTKTSLMTYNAITPKIYFLPKIHKQNTPYRPIVSCIDSPTYKLSKYLANILSNVVGETEYGIKNSFDFVNKIKNIQIPEEHMLFSLDVTSLYTNIPIHLALDIVNNKWQDISHYTKLTKEEFNKAVKFCLTNTYFEFDNSYYKQIEGCAMGSPISSVIANLVMEDLEKTCLDQLTHKPTFYYRYVDDIITEAHPNNINEILNTFNKYNSKIQHTLEIQQHKKIAFLDVQLTNDDGQILTNWYQKDTHSWRYINYFSNHPQHIKINILNNTIDRALKLSHPQFREENLNKIKTAFFNNNYPINLIKQCIAKRVYLLYNTINNNKNTNTNTTSTSTQYITIPYINKTSNLIKNTLNKYNVKTVFKTFNKNINNYTKLKPKTDIFKKSNLVYSIPCGGCNNIYVGNTSQKLINRITQHKSDTRLKPTSTALAVHTNSTGHHFDYNQTKILDNEKHKAKRYISEMLHIKRNNNTVNKKTDISTLSNIYNTILNN